LEGLGKRKTQAEDVKLAQTAGCKNHAAKRLRLSRAVVSNAERIIPPSETEASLKEQRSPSVPADVTCVVCEKEGAPSVLLICDACQNMTYMTHITCERPPLAEVPAGPWECSVCKPTKATRFAGPVNVLEDMAVINFLLNGKCDISAGDSLARVKKRSSKYQLWQGEVYLRANATRDRRLIPTKDRRLALIQSCHRDSGHYGIHRTESLLTKQYLWANRRAEIRQYVDSCETCAKFQANFNTDPKLHSIPVTPSAWHSLGKDVVGPFPTFATGKRYVVIAIDYFTKWWRRWQ
jgi:hypothetical protein